MHNMSSGIAGGDLALSDAGLTAGTTTTFTTGADLVYTVAGVFYTFSAATNDATPTTDMATGVAFKPVPVGSTCKFAWVIDPAGTVGVVQGELVESSEQYPARYPLVQSGVAVFGTLEVAVDSTGAAWTLGVDDLSGETGVTYTFVDRMCLPAEP